MPVLLIPQEVLNGPMERAFASKYSHHGLLVQLLFDRVMVWMKEMMKKMTEFSPNLCNVVYHTNFE